jgi:hypothetical protein
LTANELNMRNGVDMPYPELAT